MKKVVAYCRSGYEPQGGPSNVGRQARAIRRHAKRHGLSIREMYIDPGVSGITIERPELQRLLADCRAGKVGMVITKDTERLSRDTCQLSLILRKFQRAGVRVRFSTRDGWSPSRFRTVVCRTTTEFKTAAPRAKLKVRRR
jgi:DNA invertase Pin-like site-specific DNA recombinase